MLWFVSRMKTSNKKILIDFTKDSEYIKLFGEYKPNEGESDEKTMERKGTDTCSDETSRQKSEKESC